MIIKYFPYIIFQCTWGIFQTLAGLIMYLIDHGEKHIFYKGSIATFWKRPYGLSLGLFIFIPPRARFYNADRYHFSMMRYVKDLLFMSMATLYSHLYWVRFTF